MKKVFYFYVLMLANNNPFYDRLFIAQQSNAKCKNAISFKSFCTWIFGLLFFGLEYHSYVKSKHFTYI
jgi:hypothetical protein